MYGELTPSVFRADLQARGRSVELIEGHFIDGFKLKAPSVVSDLPDEHDFLSWLFIMQHHGTPTRLLDWTENVLVALYFSVCDVSKDDGELWAMAPVALAAASGMPQLPKQYNPTVQYLAGEPLFDYEVLNAQELLGIFDPPQYPLPILPPLNFPRMVSQSSTFTIHPRPQSGGTIVDILTDARFLVRYRIPADSKKTLLDDLSALGINQLTLFPDLDGLSVYLKQEFWREDAKPCDPPSCSGEGSDTHERSSIGN